MDISIFRNITDRLHRLFYAALTLRGNIAPSRTGNRTEATHRSQAIDSEAFACGSSAQSVPTKARQVTLASDDFINSLVRTRRKITLTIFETIYVILYKTLQKQVTQVSYDALNDTKGVKTSVQRQYLVSVKTTGCLGQNNRLYRAKQPVVFGQTKGSMDVTLNPQKGFVRDFHPLDNAHAEHTRYKDIPSFANSRGDALSLDGYVRIDSKYLGNRAILYPI